MAKKEDLKPSVLAYERKLECSNAFFNQASSKNLSVLKPIKVLDKAVRGTISNRLKKTDADDPIKLSQKIENANPQLVEVANLDEDKDTLIATFSLKILPFTGFPCTCNDDKYREKIVGIVEDNFGKSIKELSLRYACNIANGRWLWRNRINAESIRITVSNQGEELEIKDAKKIALNKFDANAEIKTIANWIENGLRGEKYTILIITAYVKMGQGQEVFPSEEMVLDKGDKGDKAKILYKDENGKAGIHSQKIGNAIRTIDDWYEDAKFPIAVEPYGSVTTMGKAFRQPKEKQDFYNLLDNWIEKDKAPELKQQHFIFAMLIRGGVFGHTKE